MFSPKKILQSPYSVLLLNQVVGKVKKADDFRRIWNNGTKRISVDGGTNVWYSLHQEDGELKLPHIVSGDFDSIDPAVLSSMRDLEKEDKVSVVHTPDQDETDFTKALQILLNHPQDPRTVVVISSDRTGRFDHFMAGINTLIKSIAMNAQVYIYDFENIIFAIPPGEDTKTVELPPGTTCGIIPIDGPTRIRSKGLKWDLDGCYGFGGIVSTSNETVRDVVTLQTDRALIFSAVITI